MPSTPAELADEFARQVALARETALARTAEFRARAVQALEPWTATIVAIADRLEATAGAGRIVKSAAVIRPGGRYEATWALVRADGDAGALAIGYSDAGVSLRGLGGAFREELRDAGVEPLGEPSPICDEVTVSAGATRAIEPMASRLTRFFAGQAW